MDTMKSRSSSAFHPAGEGRVTETNDDGEDWHSPFHLYLFDSKELKKIEGHPADAAH
jgi:hypothetical protein